MPPSPIPAPLPPWARTLLQLAPFISLGLQEVLQYFKAMGSVADAAPDEWRHIQIVWERVGNTVVADRFVNTFDIVNITNGSIDNSWTDTDYANVQANMDTMVAAHLAHSPTSLRCVEKRYYRRLFNPLTNTSEPFAPSGPPERVFLDGRVGTGIQNEANQIAITHTEKTPYPKHWGRSYWPVISSSNLDGLGRFTNSVVDTFGLALQTAFTDLQSKELFPVVPVTQIQGAPARGLLQVTQVQVDNVPDVVRRRRPRSKTHAYLGP